VRQLTTRPRAHPPRTAKSAVISADGKIGGSFRADPFGGSFRADPFGYHFLTVRQDSTVRQLTTRPRAHPPRTAKSAVISADGKIGGSFRADPFAKSAPAADGQKRSDVSGRKDWWILSRGSFRWILSRGSFRILSRGSFRPDPFRHQPRTAKSAVMSAAGKILSATRKKDWWILSATRNPLGHSKRPA
jgi:hypothetical protein